jgi:hypothetical protein
MLKKMQEANDELEDRIEGIYDNVAIAA